MKVYFDNAATTPLDREVLEAMLPYMQEHFGNPSSVHAYGRKTRTGIESARKLIARELNVSTSEIFFTSGGTEAINTAIRCAIRDLSIAHVISSRVEHHAVLHTLHALEREEKIKLSYVNLDNKGHVDLSHLEELLCLTPASPAGRHNSTTRYKARQSRTSHSSNGDGRGERYFVSLMHANNETGNLLSLKKAGELCEKYNAVFHSDTTQTMGHYKLDLQNINIDMANAAAHKFHGPKGVGFLYLKSGININPFMYGGSQERNRRGGTENVYGIVGMAKAFEIAYRDMESQQNYIQGLKNYMIEQLEKNISGIEFNGDAKESSLYTVLNVLFPPLAPCSILQGGAENAEMLLFNLDIAGIAVSGGSACTSGSNQPSHVLKEMGVDLFRPSIRFSFSKYNTKEEINFCISKLSELFDVKV